MVGGVSVAGLRPGLGRGGMTHSLLVRDNGAEDEVEVGEAAGGVWAGFIHREGWRVRIGLTSTLAVGVVAAGGDPALEAMLHEKRQSGFGRGLPVELSKLMLHRTGRHYLYVWITKIWQ